MTYKKMIENQIIHAINKYVDKHTISLSFVDMDSIELNPTKNDIEFTCKIHLNSVYINRPYRIFGYMDEFGDINVCNISYSRFLTDGVDFPQNKLYFVHGDELDTFRFDE